MKPKNTKNCRAIESTPVLKSRRANRRGSRSGFFATRPQATQASRLTAPTATRAQGQGVGPAALGPLDGGEHDADQREHGQQAAHVVDGWGVLVARVRDEAYGGHGDDEAEGRAEPEHGLPGPDLEQQPGGEQAEHRARAGHADPGADRLAALLLREGAGDDRQGGGHDQGGADAHQPAQPDQRRGRGGQRRQAGAGGEDGQAGHQDRLAAVAVTECPGGQQQPGEHQGVGVDDPLELAHRRVGGGGHVGQRHVQGGDGGHHQGQGQQDDGEYPAALGGRIVGGHGAFLPRGESQRVLTFDHQRATRPRKSQQALTSGPDLCHGGAMTTETAGATPVQVAAHQGRDPRRGPRAVRAAGLRPRQHPVHRGPGVRSTRPW